MKPEYSSINSPMTPHGPSTKENNSAHDQERDPLTRRQFLQQAALAGGLIAAHGISSSATAAQSTNAPHPSQCERIELTQNWKIKGITPRENLDSALLSDLLSEANSASPATPPRDWLAVPVMPAMVHDILLRNHKIEDPWLPGGTEKCLWVADRDWLYAVRFATPQPGRENWLRFKGLETKVGVYLNGEQIATHTDIHAPLELNVTGRLRPENTLVLHFQSGLRPGKDGKLQRPRRSSFGSYLGPNPAISPVGVFDKVFVDLTDGSLLNEVVAGFALNEALSQGTVTLDAAGTSRLAQVELRARLLDPAGKVVDEQTIPATVNGGAFKARATLNALHPRLWWPRGYGDQPLYHAELTLLAEGRPQQTERRTIGFRRITMPELLHFVVNGVPVMLRGGDRVTPNLISEVWDPEREQRLFALAENANFNIFRIWGEVIAPRDEFYELANARGFLLWHDFPKLPLAPDPKSIATATERATRMLKRLRHHPAILSWCGCNEAAMWAHEDYNSDFTDHGPWTGLPAAEAVGAICKQLDPDRYYQPSTPYYGMNPNDPREGNTHGYTNLWFVPGYDYLNFATEDTRIATPPLHSLKRFMAPEDLWPEGYTTLARPGDKYPYPKSWLPYTTSESWKKAGPVEQFYDATSPAELVYRLGMADSLYYQDTVERQRRGRETTDASGRRRCGGYIAWKFNDSWPQIYSAKVDYFLEPYHAYYALRRAYAPLLLSFEIGTFIYLWAVNDTREPVRGTVKIQLYHLEKNVFRKEITREVNVAPGASAVVVRLDEAGIRAFRREHILYATLTDSADQLLARANAFAEIERRMAFPEAKLEVKVEDGALVISTDKFARCINLEGDAGGDAFGWFFEDNYFDLLPGEEKKVRILGRHAQGRITAKPWYSPHATTVSWQR